MRDRRPVCAVFFVDLSIAMNFLSHFYFDQKSTDPHLVLGTVLPDLVKNANKSWSLQPHKHQEELSAEAAHRSILKGWQRHLVVDKYFHGSDFFQHHTQKIKEQIHPILTGSRVWPSFLAHIGLELMLDSLLITEGLIQVDDFYHQLEQVDRQHTRSFLSINQMEQPETFFTYFEHFLESRYLNSYRDSKKLVYALNRISMRIWPEGLADTNQKHLSGVILAYRTGLKADFIQIFNEIESHLHTN